MGLDVQDRAQPRINGAAWTAWSRWLRRAFERPSATKIIVAAALFVLLPTLFGGLVVDDLFHRLVVRGRLGVPSFGRLDLFAMISPDPAARARFAELGVYPWWIGPHTQVSYWRPAAALTHFVDYAFWPRAAWLMHAENLAWYAALVFACAALYRRFIGRTWMAAFATALYAFDHAHTYPAAWIANRNAIMATLFGVLAVLAHRRWRQTHAARHAFLAAAAFALALLSAESGVAIGAYLLAYAICLDNGGRLGRAASLAPYAAVVVAWRVAYRALGHGTVGSGANLDPIGDSGPFLLHMLRAGPLLLANEILAVPVDLLFKHPEWTAAAFAGSLAALGALVYVMLPLLRKDAATRFFALGSTLSVLPLGGTFPTDRYLFWAGIGIMGLFAQLAGLLFSDPPERLPRPRFAFAAICLLLRGVASPVAFSLRGAAPGLIEDDYESMVASIPRGPDFAEKTVVVLNAPLDILGMCVPIIAMGRGEPMPAHMYLLYAGTDGLTLSRSEPHVLDVQAPTGWLARESDRLLRNTPMQPGDTVRLQNMTAEVRSVTADGRPDRVRFRFPADLDDPSLLFLTWGAHGFEPVKPPSADVPVTLPPAALMVAGVMKPHIRQRAIEAP